MTDKFPEAFERFEQVVAVNKIRSLRQLLVSFKLWAGANWRGSYLQMRAFLLQAQERNFFIDKKLRSLYHIPLPTPKKAIPIPPKVTLPKTWRRETVLVRGKPQIRYRSLVTGRFIKNPEKEKKP